MSTISHHELRGDTVRILERVSSGETIEITSNGEVVAILVPPSASPYEQLLQSGAVRAAAKVPVDFRLVPRIQHELSTADMLAELRGEK